MENKKRKKHNIRAGVRCVLVFVFVYSSMRDKSVPTESRRQTWDDIVSIHSVKPTGWKYKEPPMAAQTDNKLLMEYD